jgi:hypothetical protein
LDTKAKSGVEQNVADWREGESNTEINPRDRYLLHQPELLSRLEPRERKVWLNECRGRGNEQRLGGFCLGCGGGRDQCFQRDGGRDFKGRLCIDVRLACRKIRSYADATGKCQRGYPRGCDRRDNPPASGFHSQEAP